VAKVNYQSNRKNLVRKVALKIGQNSVMQYAFDVPTPLAYFSLLVSSDEHFPLLEAAVAIALDDYPELDVELVLGEVDQLLARLKRRLPSDSTSLVKLRLLNQFFYHDLGFSGNVNNYYDPDNSYPHVVLKTRRGIPISLAVLWLELAQGLGLNARGVAFPGHFMVKVNLPKGQVVIDPFTGQSLSREDLNERLMPFKQLNDVPESEMAEADIPLGLYLQSAKPRDIITRMLHNLKEVHKTAEDWQRMIPVQDRQIALNPDAWSEYRDRGLAFAELGKATAAVRDFDVYLLNVTEAPDVKAIALRAQELRRAVI
jgi:regulator of sirC expression with transglutaminase-like and TPR domain